MALPRRQVALGIDDLTHAFELPEPILGGVVADRRIAATFHSVWDDAAVPAIPEPVSEILGCLRDNGCDGGDLGIAKAIKHVRKLAVLGRAAGIDDVPKGGSL